MRLFRRTPKPAPEPIDPAAVIAGLRTFADDLEAGDSWALDCISPRGDMPAYAIEWAEYPTSFMRQARIAYFGKPGPGEIPDADWDRLVEEFEARQSTS